MGGRRVLEGGLTITEEVVLLHGDCIGRRTGVRGLVMSMQRALHSIAGHCIAGTMIMERRTALQRNT
jgi:hypothetical protein